jgi:hypothetical protein
MNKIATGIAAGLLALAAALGSLAPAQSQGLTYAPLGYCQLTSLGSSVLLSSCSGGIPSGASLAVIAVEGAGIRYRDDGTAPSATVGMPVASGTTIQYSGTLSAVRLIQQTTTATVNVLFYR